MVFPSAFVLRKARLLQKRRPRRSLALFVAVFAAAVALLCHRCSEWILVIARKFSLMYRALHTAELRLTQLEWGRDST